MTKGKTSPSRTLHFTRYLNGITLTGVKIKVAVREREPCAHVPRGESEPHYPYLEGRPDTSIV